jgi:hypothetical protein
MTTVISPIPANANVQQYPIARSAPVYARAATASGDTVELSDAAQQALTAPTQSAPQSPPNLSELVRDAANGDISALAQLAVIG